MHIVCILLYHMHITCVLQHTKFPHVISHACYMRASALHACCMGLAPKRTQSSAAHQHACASFTSALCSSVPSRLYDLTLYTVLPLIQSVTLSQTLSQARFDPCHCRTLPPADPAFPLFSRATESSFGTTCAARSKSPSSFTTTTRRI